MKRIAITSFSAFLMSMTFVWGVSGCGGGTGNGGSNDLSCAPSTLIDPTVDLNTAALGQWTLTLTETSSTCPSPPDWITCLLNMTVSGNDVDISGTCESSSGDVIVELDNISAIVSSDTLYWGATMSATVDDYSETDTVPCTDAAFPSNSESETFNVTVSVSYNNGGTTGTCSTSFSAQFH